MSDFVVAGRAGWDVIFLSKMARGSEEGIGFLWTKTEEGGAGVCRTNKVDSTEALGGRLWWTN